MTSLTCRISRTFPKLRQSGFTFCSSNITIRTAGSWSVSHKTTPFAFLQSSSHVFSHPVTWSRYSAMLFRKCLQFTTANNSEVLVPEKEIPPITPNQWRPNLPPSTDTATTALEEMDDDLPLSALEEISEEEALQIVAEPLLPPASFTLRDYVEHSETLSKLVLLGVDLSKLEARRNVGTYLLKLDFEKDIQKTLFFLKDVGVEDGQLGPFITINPFIFTEDTEELESRVAYLESKKFKKEAIARMVSRAPYLLNFSVERLDNRLGFFQKELQLSPQKTRDLVTRYPRMLTGSLEPIKENLKVYKIEMGFRDNEIQHMVTHIPKILTGSKRRLTEIFDYVHNKMNIPHHCIVKFPQVFNTRLLKLKERHLFLAFLGRAQYDSAQPNYISLERLVSLPAEVFCEEIAKATIHDFETFLKTL